MNAYADIYVILKRLTKSATHADINNQLKSQYGYTVNWTPIRSLVALGILKEGFNAKQERTYSLTKNADENIKKVLTIFYQ